ncbi:MAG: Mrp/NBP35 family ATP-binding protein [Phycisphaerales bacterium]|nr:Mrp/NBP35 family ATP-binding protein [Phycisphaerales bacterium]MCB9835925.1 Mrp/NBP35 family ATP-binding protein [Phycisphaera sp.]
MPTLSRDFIKAALASAEGPDGVPLARHLIWSAACDTFASVKLHIEGVTDKAKLDNFARRVHGSIRAAAAEQGVILTSLIVELVDEPGTVLFTSTSGAKPTDDQSSRLVKEGESNTPNTASSTSGKPNAQAGAGSLPGVTNIIAVGAGKGGVGKSTVSVNLAVALARKGHAVGLMDGDIYGPSLPTLLGLAAHEMVVHERLIEPFYVHGIKAVTIGKMVDPEKPLIWRGPMAHGAFKQLTEQTNWGELDYLIIDLPPGTGDVPLTMAQSLQLAGAVIVCTPQRVAQDDAVRAARMFQQLGVDILGVVENMSEFIGDDGKHYDIFGKGGAETMAQRLGLPYLGDIPITMALRANSDAGNPSANFDPKTAGGEALPRALTKLAENLENQLSLAAMRSGRSKPKLTIS